MFSKLFASKMEKEMKAVCPPGTELMLQYKEGESITVSQMLKIFRDSVVLLGFFSKLRSKQITVKILSNGMSFDTVVKRMGTDKNGNALFYCQMPESFQRPKARPNHYKIYPNGSAKIILSTNRGEKSVLMPLFAVSDYGVVLANESGIDVKIGTKIFQALVTVGSMNGQLINMQVANVRTEKGPKGPLKLLSCVFTAEPRAINEMLSNAKSLAPKPKPKPK